MSLQVLQAALPIVYNDGTMQYPFRDYMLALGAYISPDYTDETETTYTLTLFDANKVMRFTGASPAVTIPQESAVDYILGTEISIRQAGTGTLVLTTTGLTINGSVPAWSQHVETKFRKVAADEWDVV
jgi:hypothetical protein